MRQTANASDITDINLPGGNTDESRSLQDGRLRTASSWLLPRDEVRFRASESPPSDFSAIDSRSPQRYLTSPLPPHPPHRPPAPPPLLLEDPLSFRCCGIAGCGSDYGRSLNPSNGARAMILLNPHKVSSWRQDLELRMVMGEVDSGKREVLAGDSQFAACTS
jgi:hypothetical protein